MKVIIHPSFIQTFNRIKSKSGTFPVFGKIFDNYSICHLIELMSSTTNSEFIGYLTLGYNELKLFNEYKFLNYPFLHVKMETEDINDLKVDIHLEKEKKESDLKTEIEKIDLKRLFVRIDENETPLKILREKRIAIIGMGSGGSLLAVYLAKSGIREFIFIDGDRLETHNIIRHTCDLTQLGRYKTKAVKDFIISRIPDVSIRTIEKEFLLHTRADSDYFLELLKNVDLIVAASGEHIVNFALNDFIFSNNLKIPIIFAGTFDGVKGGLMFKVDPRKEDYCYHCVYSDPISNGNIKTSSIPTTSELEKKIVYDRTLQEAIAQPGLGLDIDNLTIFLSKFCLDLLLMGTEHGLYHFPHNFYMWFNRTVMNHDESSVKFEGLELYFFEDLEKNPNCPYHGIRVLE
ncbi:MAG: ThiF family adenylyltransferase [Candidatus Hodarchaeota archaeon]